MTLTRTYTDITSCMFLVISDSLWNQIKKVNILVCVAGIVCKDLFAHARIHLPNFTCNCTWLSMFFFRMLHEDNKVKDESLTHDCDENNLSSLAKRPHTDWNDLLTQNDRKTKPVHRETETGASTYGACPLMLYSI